MSQTLILLPVFGQVFLTFLVLILLGIARQASLAAKGRSIEDIALSGDDVWDEHALKRSNNFKNQFELPVLFYAVCAFALITRMVDIAFLCLAFGFFFSRIVQTYVHLTFNRVSIRGGAYIIGFVCLVAMWVILAVRITMAGF
ncbi:MAG: MAPEG family protein [Pseudomonadota bacterium]